ncbi:flagellar assembly protein FliH, partial [Salmonella enterica]|nr:flagellar assembly protein FliH [Salmonella enterica]
MAAARIPMSNELPWQVWTPDDLAPP